MLKGWRTVIFNGAVMLPALVDQANAYLHAFSTADLSMALGVNVAAVSRVTFLVGLGNVMLRAITTTPVGKRE